VPRSTPALEDDPQRFHLDSEAAKATFFGGLAARQQAHDAREVVALCRFRIGSGIETRLELELSS
jgi:hypothetical protein